MLVEHGLERALEGGPIFSVWTVVDHGRGNRMRLGTCEPRGIRPVRNHQRDLGGGGAPLRRPAQRRHVGAATGDQDGDALLDHPPTGKDTAPPDTRTRGPDSPPRSLPTKALARPP